MRRSSALSLSRLGSRLAGAESVRARATGATRLRGQSPEWHASVRCSSFSFNRRVRTHVSLSAHARLVAPPSRLSPHTTASLAACSPSGVASQWTPSSRKTGARASPAPPSVSWLLTRPQLREASQQRNARRAAGDALHSGNELPGRAHRQDRPRRHPSQGKRPRPEADCPAAHSLTMTAHEPGEIPPPAD